MYRTVVLILISYWVPSIYSQHGFAAIRTNCTKDLMQIDLKMDKPFKGLIFAKGFSEECGARGDLSNNLKLLLPVSACGIRYEMIGDSLKYTVTLVAQMDYKLQQKSDLETVVQCMLPVKMMDVNLDQSNRIDQKQRNGRMRLMPSHSSAKVRAWMELGGKNGIGLVEVGQNTSLSIHLVLTRKFGVRVVDCICFDGIGEISQKLFDDNGCPVDSQIMPEFKEHSKNMEEGWSKPSDDDLVVWEFKTDFPAFKFPDRDVLHLTCGIQLCNGECPKKICLESPSKENDSQSDPYMARIEVFNSLKVMAPQIEIDRIERNQSTTALPVRFLNSNSDVLCISQSKLALAFCVLGMIFLIAVIVAVSCSLRNISNRNRSRLSGPPSDQSGRRSIFSVISTSSQESSRIDSKLFSYGRVY